MKKRNFMLSVLICSSIVASNVVPAFAYNLEGKGLKDGVENVTYYIDSSASGLADKISSAAYSWSNTDSPVHMKKTTRSSSAIINIAYDDDAFTSKDDASGTVAQTTFSEQSDGRWYDADINVNPSVYASLTLKNTNNTPIAYAQQGTLAHEMGHAMGLAHNFSADVLMNQLGGGRKVYTPQTDDVKGIDVLYNYGTSRSAKLASINNSTTSSAVTINSSDFSHLRSEEDTIKTYNNFDELANDSNAIIQGKIVDTKPYFNKYGIYTDVKIKVVNSLTGALKPDAIINMRLHGGILEGKDAKEFRTQYMERHGITSDNVSSEKVEEVANGLDNFKTGDNSIFFLNYANNEYFVTGSHQGIFKLTNNNVQLPRELKNKYKNIKGDSFITNIKNSISNTNKK